MVAVAGYFDDSHQGDVYAVAGYLGRVDVWDERFSVDWRRVLTQGDRRISEFKAADCRHGVGQFSGWPKGERDRLTEQLVDLIVDTATYPDLFGLGVAVAVPRQLAVETLRVQYEGWAYCLCLGTLVLDAIKITHRLGDGDSLHFIFDRQRGLETKANEIYDEALDAIKAVAPIRPSIHPLDFADSKALPPLQAADLLAYETYKEMRNRQESPPRTASIALQRLVSGRLHGATYYDSDMVLDIMRRSREVDPPPDGQYSFPSIYGASIARRIARDDTR